MDTPAPRSRPPILWILAPFVIVAAVVAVCLLTDRTRKTGPTVGPRVYAQIFIPRTPGRLLTEPNLHAAPGEPEFEDFRRTQAALIRSQFVLNAALRPPEVAQLSIVRAQADPVAWLADALYVGFPESPEVMRVGLDGDNVEELRTLVNAIVDAYLREVVGRELTDRTTRLRRLEEMTAQAEDSMKRKRDTLRQLQAQGPPSQDSLERQLLVQDIQDCRRELRRVRLARAGAEAVANPTLEAQEKLLQNEEKALLAKVAAWERSALDLAPLRAEVEHGEDLVRRLRSAAATLRLEMDAPPRAMLLERAIVRGKE